MIDLDELRIKPTGRLLAEVRDWNPYVTWLLAVVAAGLTAAWLTLLYRLAATALPLVWHYLMTMPGRYLGFAISLNVAFVLVVMFAPRRKPMSTEHLDVHAALNTYETVAASEGIYLKHGTDDYLEQVDVIGANYRRLIVRDTDEGLYVGGCLITDHVVARVLGEALIDWAGR